ncbi:hypothetical protein [Nocardia sp. NPDC060249]|uniref:hypothetical protein n=1 Tax=Nocardia sp. NPDC060249 TaxID=3347082 RepID=UPI003649AFD4
MGADINFFPRTPDGEGGDHEHGDLGWTAGLGPEPCDSDTVHLHDVVDQLEYTVQICSQESIPLPFVLNEVESALGVALDDSSADWRSALHLHLVDYVTSAFAKHHLQRPPA